MGQRVESIGDWRAVAEAAQRRCVDLEQRLDELEKALETSEARYRTFVDHTADGVFLRDSDGRIVDANRQACESLGYRREELLGMEPFEFDAELTPASRRRIVARLEAGETVVFDTRHRRRDGTTFPVEVRVRPFWVDGQRYSLSLARDITERKATEAELEASEARYRTFADHVTDGLFLHEQTGRVVDVNRQACRSLGYEREELIGMMPVQFDADITEAEVAERMAQLMAGESLTFESRHRRKDGTIFPVEIRVRSFWMEGKFYALALACDITERRRAEEELVRRQAELLHAARLTTMGRMVAALAHEVAQPLSAIGNFAAAGQQVIEGLRRGESVAAGSESLHGYLEAISKQNQRCGAILQRLRDFSQRTSAKHVPCPTESLIRESIALVANELRRHDVGVRFELAADLPPVVGDPVELQQVVVNLMTNARDALGEEPVERRIITIRAYAEAENVVLEVHDCGRGLSDDVRARIFEPFFTTKKAGMGIGLSICQSIVKHHQGEISAFTNEQGGATFRVQLPQAPEQQSSSAAEQ